MGFGPAQGGSNGSGSVSWPLIVPDGLGAITQIQGPSDRTLIIASGNGSTNGMILEFDAASGHATSGGAGGGLNFNAGDGCGAGGVTKSGGTIDFLAGTGDPAAGTGGGGAAGGHLTLVGGTQTLGGGINMQAGDGVAGGGGGSCQMYAGNASDDTQGALIKCNGGVFGGTLGTIDLTGPINVSAGINTTAGDAATINAAAGRFRKDTTGTTFTLTNSHITANSIVMLQFVSDDATATRATVVAGAGSATITFNAAPTSNCDVNFWVVR